MAETLQSLWTDSSQVVSEIAVILKICHISNIFFEGVLVPGRRFVVGTQWHPEWRAMENPFSRALFGAFGEACRAAAAAKE